MPYARVTQQMIGPTALVLLALGGTPGCNREIPASETSATPPVAAGAAARDDSAIATSVRAKFYTDDTIRGRQVDVTAEDGVVTLSGTVDNAAAKQHAVNLAQTVDGVVRVNNELTIARNDDAGESLEPAATTPTGTAGRDASVRSPGWITTKIQAQYFLSPHIKPWPVDVTTSTAGVVTLEGTVDSDAKKAEVVRIARGTDGVENVVDRITVRADADAGSWPVTAAVTDVGQPDPWITAKIQARYFVDDDIKGRSIDVDTRSGQVTLKGAVGSEAERRQAVAIARNTGGVKEVVDELRVQSGDRGVAPSGPANTALQPVDGLADPWTTTKIQAKYFLDSDVKGREIAVDTRGGVVTLKGTVGTEAQKKEAEQIARETDGVTRVVNQLTVGPSENQ